MLNRLRSIRADDIISLDLRSLAALRIALGALVLVDTLLRLRSWKAHYTDDGVLPRRMLDGSLHEFNWSLLKLHGGEGFVLAVFAITIVASLMMIAGFVTRFATIATWALLWSIQVRNPIVSSGVDTLMIVLMFWAMLLPLGRVWSVDARLWKRDEPPVSMTFTSMATAGFLIQIACMYWFTAWLKDGASWRSDGTALYYATGALDITRPFGEWLHGYPDLLRVLTHTSLAFEFLVPFLFFSPWFRTQARLLAVFGAMAFHAGIWLIMDVGLFPFVSAFCMVGLLPAAFWDAILKRVRGTESSPSQERGEPRRQMQEHPIVDAVAAFCILFIVYMNLTTVTSLDMTRETRALAYATTLDQSWAMFAPNPSRVSEWQVLGGLSDGFEGGNYIDAVQYGDMGSPDPYTIEKPDDIVGTYFKDKYWRKYFEHIVSDRYEEEQLALASYLCTQWNKEHDGAERLKQISLVRVRVPTLDDGEWGRPTPDTVATWACGG